MHKIAKGAAALALVCSSAASAQSTYWGGTAGLMDIDLPNADSPINLGLRGGFTLPSGWGFEGEYTNSLISGDADVFDRDVDVDIQTLAGYGTTAPTAISTSKAAPACCTRMWIMSAMIPASPWAPAWASTTDPIPMSSWNTP